MTEHRQLMVPAMGLVVLVGVSGSGKSTFGRRHFKPTEVVSSDAYATGRAAEPRGVAGMPFAVCLRELGSGQLQHGDEVGFSAACAELRVCRRGVQVVMEPEPAVGAVRP